MNTATLELKSTYTRGPVTVVEWTHNERTAPQAGNVGSTVNAGYERTGSERWCSHYRVDAPGFKRVGLLLIH